MSLKRADCRLRVAVEDIISARRLKTRDLTSQKCGELTSRDLTRRHQITEVDIARLVSMFEEMLTGSYCYSRRSRKFLCQLLSSYSNFNLINELFYNCVFFLHLCILLYRLFLCSFVLSL